FPCRLSASSAPFFFPALPCLGATLGGPSFPTRRSSDLPALLRIVRMARGNNFCADALVRERVRSEPMKQGHHQAQRERAREPTQDRKSTRLNSSHVATS